MIATPGGSSRRGVRRSPHEPWGVLDRYSEFADLAPRPRPVQRNADNHAGASHANFELETVAEWVTSEQDAILLESYGIDFFQGHHFGRPEIYPSWMSADAAIAAA